MSPKVILCMFGCDVHLAHRLKKGYDTGLEYETVNLRLMEDEVFLTPSEVSELRDYLTDWLNCNTKGVEGK